MVRQDSHACDTVHLSQWPEADLSLLNEELNGQMALIQRIASLGHAARQGADLKVRQPLSEVIIQLAEPTERETIARYEEMLCQELNVKKVTLDSASELIQYEVFPLPRQLGQKYGAGYPKIRAALAQGDQKLLAETITRNGLLQVRSGDMEFPIALEEVEIRKTPRQGFSVADMQGYLVAIPTEVSPELLREGYVRELVRHVQQYRKDLGLDISDRIKLQFQERSSLLEMVLAEHSHYLQKETLAVDITFLNGQVDDQSLLVSLGNESISLQIEKV